MNWFVRLLKKIPSSTLRAIIDALAEKAKSKLPANSVPPSPLNPPKNGPGN